RGEQLTDPIGYPAAVSPPLDTDGTSSRLPGSVMPNYPISQGELDALGRKLQGLEFFLSDEERAVLAGVFAIVAEAIKRPAGGPSESAHISRVDRLETPAAVDVEGQLPSIREEFARAFAPG